MTTIRPAPAAKLTAAKLTAARLTAAVLVLLLALAGCSSSGADSPPAPSDRIGTRVDDLLPAGVLAAPLIDSTGHLRPLSSFDGKVLVIADSMTLCQETCPVDTAAVVETARAVDKAGLTDKVEFVTITVDPRRDTPKRLAAYRKLYAPAPKNWITLTGSPTRIHSLWKSFGVYWEKVPSDSPAPIDWMTGKPLTYDIDHSDEIFFVDGAAHDRFVLEGSPHVNSSSAVPPALYKFMDAEGHKNVNDPAATAWTVPQALSIISWLTGSRIG